MSNVRHVAPAPALASSTPDRACTTDLIAQIHVSARGNQGLGRFRSLYDHERGSAVLAWERVGAHGREEGRCFQ